MAINYQVFKNVSNVTLAGTALYGVQAVRVVKKRPEIHASGDADVFEPIAEVGSASVSGTIVTLDPAGAEALDGLSGTLSFVWKDAKGAADKTVTISNVIVTGVSNSVAHDAASSASVAFIASSSDGATDPVAIA